MKRLGKSKGVGSIVGSVFILLIVLSSYSLNQLNSNMQYSYQGALSKSNQVEVDRHNEKLHIYKLWVDGLDQLYFGVINRGSISMKIKHIGIFDTSVSPENHTYYDESLEIKPFENITRATGITIDPEKTYLVQLVSERGNFWNEEYPFVPEATVVYNNTYILTNGTQVEDIVENMYEKEMVESFGALEINHSSFEWARRDPSDQVTGFTWSKNAYVDEDHYLVMRINVTNLGSDTYLFGDYTCIGFQICRLGSDVDYRQFYIVDSTGTYSDPTIQTYNDGDVSIFPQETKTLYFAVEDNGDNPSLGGNSQTLYWDGECIGTVLFYDVNENYGQAISAIALRSYN